MFGLVCAATAAAQEREQDVFIYRSGRMDPAGAQAGPLPVPGVPFHFELPVDVLAAEPLDVGEPVTGAPYSAEIVTEILQPLADGNRIERRTRSAVARDGEGRVRREQALAAIGPILPQGDVQIVTINDPVAKVHFSLDAARKVAIQSPMMFTQRLEWTAASAASAATVTSGTTTVSSGAATIQMRRLQAVGAAQAQDARTEQLGTRDIEGVKVEGTRTTITIPTGAIGNVAPIEIVSERWYSAELRTVLSSRRSDPRFGETTYRLENIVRAEPSPELFQVPPDYTVEKGGPGMAIERRIIRGAPAQPR
jgi:hypothetical protein